jgi:ankyrin repeat protein
LAAAIVSLLKRGALVNARNDLERTPLHLAVANGHFDAVAALLAVDIFRSLHPV